MLQDEQKNLFEFLFALVLNVVFLAAIALLLWPLGKLTLALGLAKGYGVLWIVIGVTAGALNGIHRLFRVNMYDHPDAFVYSNLAVSCLLQAGWAAFAALAIHGLTAGAPGWVAVILYFVGVLSCIVAFVAVSAFYQGHIYRLISLPLALASFLVFSVLLHFRHAEVGQNLLELGVLAV